MTQIDIEKTGERIRSLARKRRLEVNKIAEECEMSSWCVYKWLAGKRIPSLQNLAILSELLETPISDILVLNNDK